MTRRATLRRSAARDLLACEAKSSGDVRVQRGAEMAVMMQTSGSSTLSELAATGAVQSASAGKVSPRVAVISDTIDNIDGIAIGLRRLVASSRRAGHTIALIGPAGQGTDGDLVR